MAPPSTVCNTCSGKFSVNAFIRVNNNSASGVCRWCDIRETLMQELNKEKEHRAVLERKFVDMKRKLDELTETSRSSQGESRVQLTNNTNRNPAEISTPIVNGAASQQEFTLVKNGIQPKLKKDFLPTTITNRFLIPGFEDEFSNEVRIVGDSILRGQLNEFCGRNPSKRRNYCMPGGKIEHINDSIEIFTEGGTKDTGYIIHVGSNNIINNRSEELLSKYKELISNLKNKTNNIIISGVLPRFGDESTFLGRAIYINNIMKVICREENVHFINLWEHFL